jgi:hypothetical protein
MAYIHEAQVAWPSGVDVTATNLLVNNYDPSAVWGAFSQLAYDQFNYAKVGINFESYGTDTSTGAVYYGIAGPPLCSNGTPPLASSAQMKQTSTTGSTYLT